MRKHLTVRLDPRAVKAIEDVSGHNGGNINRAINQLIRAGHPWLQSGRATSGSVRAVTRSAPR